MPNEIFPKSEPKILAELYGLVLCGGQSSRMNFDKSLISYHGQPQRNYLYSILNEICSHAFMSCNSSQADSIPSGCNKIIDLEKFGNIGPMKALLSAFEMHPEKSWLLIGCDYPFLKKGNLIDLVEFRDSFFDSVAYFNKEQNFAEPLITIYENGVYRDLLSSFNQREFSLKHFLSKLNSTLIVPEASEILTSVDTKESSELAIQKLLISKS